MVEERLRVPDSELLEVYLERGNKRVFAGAIDWPGWCRIGRDEASALASLIQYSPRYASVLLPLKIGFQPPGDVSALTVVERLTGNATTDFGAPDAAPSRDANPVNEAELKRLQALLQACWLAFDTAAQAASGKELRKGPRGGGRDLEKIAQHVIGADAAYLSRLGVSYKTSEENSSSEEFKRIRTASLEGLASAAHGELPARGPRGGTRWTTRFFVRRSAWHVLDHAWEIEDRLL